MYKPIMILLLASLLWACGRGGPPPTNATTTGTNTNNTQNPTPDTAEQRQWGQGNWDELTWQ